MHMSSFAAIFGGILRVKMIKLEIHYVQLYRLECDRPCPKNGPDDTCYVKF